MDMKATKNTITGWLVMAMALTLVSCGPDWDSDRGYMLSGKWFGDVGMYIDGRPARGSVLEFIPTGNYTTGYGTEIDYYGRYGVQTVYHEFDWYIADGVIVMLFDNPDLDCKIWDYSLSDSYFTGYMDGAYSETRFRLQSYGKYWYTNGYGGYDYGYDWFSLPLGTRSADARGDTLATREPVCSRRVKDMGVVPPATEPDGDSPVQE